MQGAGGVIVPPAGYLRGAARALPQHEILFVADEVITGFGRLGAWFASELWDLEPDLMTMAKGITSGYVPLGATMVSDEIADDARSAAATSRTASPTAAIPATCAAALANLDIIEREKLVERVRDDVGPYFQERLRAFAGHPAVGEVRGFGADRRARAARPPRRCRRRRRRRTRSASPRTRSRAKKA